MLKAKARRIQDIARVEDVTYCAVDYWKETKQVGRTIRGDMLFGGRGIGRIMSTWGAIGR